MECISGLMVEDMRGSGKMASSMARANTFCQIIQLKLVFGKMERESDGSSSITSMKMEAIKDK